MMNHAIETITNHGKENKSTYMINLFGSIIPIIMFLIYASVKLSGIATEAEVSNLIISHANAGMHPAAEQAVGNVQEQLDSILSFQIEERIEKQLMIVCMNPNLRAAIEPTVKQLIRDYNKVSPTPYIRPTCAQLGVN